MKAIGRCIWCVFVKRRASVELRDDVVDGDDGADLNRSAGSVAHQAKWDKGKERERGLVHGSLKIDHVQLGTLMFNSGSGNLLRVTELDLGREHSAGVELAMNDNANVYKILAIKNFSVCWRLISKHFFGNIHVECLNE